MKKRILFMIHDLQGGGAEKVLVNLVNNLNQEKYDITVCALFGGGINEQFIKPHINYYAVWKKVYIGNSQIMKIMTPEQLHRLCVKGHYDIEISFLEGPTARIISGCKDKKTKLISWIHVEQHTVKVVSHAFRSYIEAVRCYQKYDKTVCVSEFVKNDFSSIVPLLNPPVVIHNAVDVDKIKELEHEPVTDVCFNSDEFNLVAVGKIMKKKGFDRLARIHKRFIEDKYPVHFFVLGVGPEQDSIERYLQDNRLSESFTFLGYQLNPYKYVSRCDLFVCSSYAEGFSTAATEALIVGTPICTVDVSGMKEMLGYNNEYGIITENNESALYEGIRQLLDDNKKLSYYKKMAAERGMQCSLEKAVNSVETIIDSL